MEDNLTSCRVTDQVPGGRRDMDGGGSIGKELDKGKDRAVGFLVLMKMDLAFTYRDTGYFKFETIYVLHYHVISPSKLGIFIREGLNTTFSGCLLYTSPSPRD